MQQPDTDAVLDDEATDRLRALGSTLFQEFDFSRKMRQEQDKVWLQDLRQLKGIYDPEILARIGPRRSQIFIRATRAKLKAVNARVRDLLFPAGDKNWRIEPTPVAELDEERHIAALARFMYQRAVVGLFDPPQESDVMAYLQDEAKKACDAMENEIADQLNEARFEDHAVQVQKSAHLFGIGILKGPLTERAIEFVWQPDIPAGGIPLEQSFSMQERERKRPWVGAVNIWRFYPDPYASNPDECEYFWEEHVLTRFDLLKLAKRRGFNEAAIRRHLHDFPDGSSETPQTWESELRQMPSGADYVGVLKNRYRLRERWGYLSGNDLQKAGLEVDPETMEDAFECHVFMLGDEVVKASKNPTPGQYRPYNFYYFDKDESSIWGEGLGGVYRDPQKMINASTRMALDNGAISSGPQIEVNRTMMDDEEDFESVVPFRVWVRSGLGADAGAPALRVYDIQSKVRDHLELLRVAKDLGDEVSSAPSYAYGQPSSQAANTLGGLSILMGNINISLKDLAAGWDQGITRPFIGAMYSWNMAFNERKDIKGDFRVKAMGVTSLLAKELRSHALETFRTSTSNAIDGPFTKRIPMLRETAKALDLSPDELVASDEEIAQYRLTGIASWIVPPPPMLGAAGGPAPGANPAQSEPRSNAGPMQ